MYHLEEKNMKIKKLISAAAAAMLCLSMFTACGSTSDNSADTSAAGDAPAASDGEKYKIGVIQIVEHTSLNTIRDAFTEQMKELGYIDGENAEFEYQSAQGEVTTANSIIQSFQSDGKDIIVAIATPTAQAAASASDEIPVVFSAVTDPVAAGLVDSLESTGRNITGTSDKLQINLILDFATSLTPIQTLGFLYNPGEANSVSCLEEVKAYCDEHGITVVEKAVSNTSEVQQAAQVMFDEVDAGFSPIDNTVATAMAAVSEAAKEAKKPMYVGADSMVIDGGFATLGIDYTDLGKETANMADQILKGEKKPSEIPVKVFDTDLHKYVNKTVAEAIGVTIPDDVLNDENAVIVE